LHATEMDEMIPAQARADRADWISRGLKDKFWEPIKALKKKRTPQVVALVPPRGQVPSVHNPRPADVYAEYLEQTHWGRGPAAMEPGRTSWGRRPIGRGGEGINTGEIEKVELDAAIAVSKAGKVPGLDNLPAECWKALDKGRATVLALLSKGGAEGQVPASWRRALVVGIHRKRKATEPANYRPISLLSTAYKLLGRIVATRMQEGLEESLRQTQYGFRRGRSTAVPLFIVRRHAGSVGGPTASSTACGVFGLGKWLLTKSIPDAWSAS